MQLNLGMFPILVTKLKMRGNEMIGEAEILNTPCGQVAQALIKGGVKVRYFFKRYGFFK